MSFLADTHILVWAAQEPERLPKDVRELFENEHSDIRFSVISVWEVALKAARRPDQFPFGPDRFRNALLENGLSEIPVNGQHAVMVETLQPIHGDPFDRMLIAQAMCEGLTLITADTLIARYSAPIWRV